MTSPSSRIEQNSRTGEGSCAVEQLRRQLGELATAVRRDGDARFAGWRPRITRSSFEPGARNLAQYLALRGHDLRGLQLDLSERGLSSLGRCEAHVIASLDAVTDMLDQAAGARSEHVLQQGWKAASWHDLDRQSTEVFGPDPTGPRSRIMVTVGADAVGDPSQIRRLIEAGADCIRINCAHDNQETWSKLIAQTRKGSAHLKRDTRVLMDIAGPKVRIADVASDRGRRVYADDTISVAAKMRGARASRHLRISISEPEILKRFRAGQTVAIDDGKVACVVERREHDGVVLRVTRVRPKGVKIRAGKGLNFPDLELDLAPLTEKDLRDLDFVAAHADIVGYSFVQQPADIRLLQAELVKRIEGRPLPPLVVKIETRLGVANLPEIIVAAAGRQPAAIMIARGDLAVELGLQEMSETQEQLLWLCEAAHIPVVWATQVLDGLLKTGVPSRAETTDAAMAQRAECVMLNKGPHAIEAVRFLDNILHRMDKHVVKKSPLLGALARWTRTPAVSLPTGTQTRQRKSRGAGTEHPRRSHRTT